MNQRTFSAIVLFALVMALGSAAFVTQRASAACYDNQKQPVPCPQQPNDKKKKPVPTDTATITPSPQPTKEAGSVSAAVVVTPDAQQLALLCAQLPAVQGSNGGPNALNATGPGGGPGAPVTPPNTAGFSGFELGGGGLLLGVLIGLLVPAVLRGFNGGIFRGADVNGDGRSGNSAGFDIFTTPGDAKGAAGTWDKHGEAGMDDWERGGGGVWQKGQDAALNYSKQGDAGLQDLHQKASGDTFDKDAKAGYFKQDGAGMGDGSVHNMNNQFQKGSDAGITDGSSFTGGV